MTTLRLDDRRIHIDLPGAEAIERFECFGGNCSVLVTGSGPGGTARQAAREAKSRLLAWHCQFSRFDPDSELSRLGRDPRGTVPVSPMMIRFVSAAVRAAERTGGLVDPTLVGEIEKAGYEHHFASQAMPLTEALELAPPRARARPNPASRWRQVSVDPERGTVTRPPGLRLDSGGVLKGLVGDVLAQELSGHRAFAIDAAGDVRFGGSDGLLRPIEVMSPFGGSVLHVFELAQGAAATSGIGKRSWPGPDGRPSHHLLDPATGRPAFTGVVQVTAIASTAFDAELLSKTALLSGAGRTWDWLPYGGLVVYDDGTVEVAEPR